MNELTPAQLLERVTQSRVAPGNPRVRDITQRIVSDLFRTIDDFDVSPDEFWAAVDWLTRLGQSGQAGLITAGLGFDRLLDIRAEEADARAGRVGGTPRAIEGPLYVAGAPLAKGEVRPDEGERQRGDVLVAAPGLRTLTTQINIPGDTFIDDDFAFATRDELVVDLEPNTAPSGYESLGVVAPFTRVRFDFVLQAAASTQESAPQSRLARALS